MSRPYTAIIPQSISDGDKIILKGLVKQDAYEFSINFATGTSPYPEDITYHFKTILPENTVVENSKKNGDWMYEQRKEWPGSDGPGFALEFAFNDGYIHTYMVEDEDSRNFISSFEHNSDLNEIDSVQVWGDVDKITELTFRYS